MNSLGFLGQLRTSQQERIACVGDNCVDVYVDSGALFAGGNAVNVAVNLARHGASSHFFGRIGGDPDGALIESVLKANDVTCRSIVTPEPTCRGLLRVDESGLTTLVGMEGDCSYLALDDATLTALSAFDLVFMKAVAGTDETMARLRALGCATAYDYSTFHDELGGAAADIGFFSFGEGMADAAMPMLLDAQAKGARAAIATLGADGAVGRFGEEVVRVSAPPVEVVDTIGAGDAFIAMLLLSLLRGSSPAEAMQAAARAGSLACTHSGAFLQTPITPEGVQ